MTEPPGGPPDSTPPHIILVHPESGSVVPKLDDDAIIRFDDVIDELSGGGGGGSSGAKGIASRIILSPVGGMVNVSWHRAAIHVKPAEGWKKGRIYHLEVLPGLADLRHNMMKEGSMVIFSTGPAIPRASLTGTALQWADQRVVPQAAIRATLLPDTAAYVTIADSSGDFRFSNIPRGRYRVYAIQDQNGDRRIDPREPFDSTVVTVDTSASIVMWAFVHDTTGPKLNSADPVDSLTVRLTLSQPLDPKRPLDTLVVRVLSLPDSGVVRVRTVLTGALADSMQARERAIADSLRRAKDTTRAAPPPGAARPNRPPAQAPGKRDTTVARVDTARIHQLLRARPIPTDRWVLKMARPLKPGSKYLVRIRGAVNLTGAKADPQAVLVVPVPPKAPPAGKDTVRNKPAPPPPPAPQRR